ncbi:MAG: peptidoglycan DD-metalloendopeptidase family protein [Clostridia bacterium]|nr:peptidoglycan DD-metalloendopeptidase family protein [Clostridia bacterium]
MKLQRIISLVMCFVVFACCCYSVPVTAAKTATELQQQIDKLEKEEKELEAELKSIKNDKAKQQQVKNNIEKKIANLQSQIDICNSKIESNNKIIAKNEASIADQKAEMEQIIFEFKKRIRAIYMSGSVAGGLEILLGADDFADFIALSQLTQNISRRDRKMVDEIVSQLKVVQEKIDQNKLIIEEQNEIKATLKEKQDKLDIECAEVLKVIAEIQKNQNSVNNQLNKTENENKKAEEELEEILQSSNGAGIEVPFNGKFKWPCPGYTNITSGYGYRWGRLHKGIDIAQSGISGKKVVAAASGTVTVGCNTCTHNYGKVNSNGTAYSCACGGYGNYIMIDHGKHNGKYYRTVYAHLKPGSITHKTGQKVNQGEKIGAVGTTGNSTGYHLHFEIRVGTSKSNLSPVNPKDYV